MGMLEIKGLRKVFGAGTVDEHTALDGIDLDIERGQFVTVIGSNGAGKSTLFNAVCGNFPIDAGRILLDGENITHRPDYKRARVIGRLFQDPMRGSAPGMSIEENLALAAGTGSWLSSIKRSDRQRFREILRELDMGLEDRMTQPVGLLSGGQRQALTLMMATVNPPKLLLLDEHTAALDPATAEKVLDITKKTVSEQGLTCMMVTHNMQSAIDLGDRLIMMNKGRIIFDASGDEKRKLTVPALMELFRNAAGESLATDRILLGE